MKEMYRHPQSIPFTRQLPVTSEFHCHHSLMHSYYLHNYNVIHKLQGLGLMFLSLILIQQLCVEHRPWESTLVDATGNIYINKTQFLLPRTPDLFFFFLRYDKFTNIHNSGKNKMNARRKGSRFRKATKLDLVQRTRKVSWRRQHLKWMLMMAEGRKRRQSVASRCKEEPKQSHWKRKVRIHQVFWFGPKNTQYGILFRVGT